MSAESFEFAFTLASSNNILCNSSTLSTTNFANGPTSTVQHDLTDDSACMKQLNFISGNDEIQLIGPSSRWHSQPRSYKGAIRDGCSHRKFIRKIPSFIDITDGDTSGMGSSVDEPIESSAESASEASISAFQMPKASSRILASSPTLFKKRRGGWPKGTKRKPELQGIKAPKPKAPVTAYILYLNDRRKYYKETHSTLPYVEVFKLVGAEWSALPAEQKASYNARAEQEKKRYKSELQAYRQSPDYLLQLRKKRLKNTRKGETTTEESSDFTDEIDDDDSEELYCRICDQWFYSHHNKRVHLRGKLHGKAVMGEYQRERKAEELRQESPLEISEMVSITKNFKPCHSDLGCNEKVKKNSSKMSLPTNEDSNKIDNCYNMKISESGNYAKSSDDLLSMKYRYNCRGKFFDMTSTTEDDQEDDDAERVADEEYDGEEEITEEEGGLDSDRVTDAAEDVLFRMIEREKEILWLRKRREKALYSNKKLSASLLGLGNRQKKLHEEKLRILAEERLLKKKIQHYSFFFRHHPIAGSSNNDFTYGTNSRNYLTIDMLGNDHNDSQDTEKNNPWRIQCATSPTEFKEVANNLKLKTKSLNCNVRLFKKVTENSSCDIKVQEKSCANSFDSCDPKKLIPNSLKLKMRCVKVKNSSFSSKDEKETSYEPKCSVYTTSQSEAITCNGSPIDFMTEKCEQTYVESFISQEAKNVPNNLRKLAIGKKSVTESLSVISKNEGSNLNAITRNYEPSSKSNLFANSTKFPTSPIYLKCNDFNLVSQSMKSNSVANFDAFGRKYIVDDVCPENENLDHIPFNTAPYCDHNVSSTSFISLNSVKPPSLEITQPFCFSSKHNDPNSALIVANSITNSPPFRDCDNDLLSSNAVEISKVPNNNSFFQSLNKSIESINHFLVQVAPATNSGENSCRDLSYSLEYTDHFENAKSSPCKDALIHSQSPPKNSASDISQYNGFCDSARISSAANESRIEDISLSECALNISSNFYDDKHLKMSNQPVICEETFFKQFGLDFDYKEHSNIKNADIIDHDVILQFSIADDDLTTAVDRPN